MNPLRWLNKIFYFLLEYLGIIEVVFHIKYPKITMVVFLNYLFGRKVVQISEGQIIDPLRIEFSLERFIEKNSKIPILISSLILPQENIVNKVITVPDMDKRRLKNFVVSYLEGMGIFDISSLSFNYRVVGKIVQKGKVMLKVFVSAIKQGMIYDYISIFKSAGIVLKSVSSSTIPLVNLLKDIDSRNAVIIVFNKGEEVFIATIQGKNILRLEVIENIDKSVVQRYVIGVVTDIVKERNIFLEKVIFFNVDYEIIENVFEATNIICLPGEKFFKYELTKYPLGVIDIFGFVENPKFSLNLLPARYINPINLDIFLVRGATCLIILSIIFGLFILLFYGDIEKQKVIDKSLSSPGENIPEEIKRYIVVMNTKNQMDFYSREVVEFYSKFKNTKKSSNVLYDIFSSIDENTWLKEIKLFPELVYIKGYSLNSKSLNDTIRNISSVEYVRKVIVNSLADYRLKNMMVVKFDLEIEL